MSWSELPQLKSLPLPTHSTIITDHPLSIAAAQCRRVSNADFFNELAPKPTFQAALQPGRPLGSRL